MLNCFILYFVMSYDDFSAYLSNKQNFTIKNSKKRNTQLTSSNNSAQDKSKTVSSLFKKKNNATRSWWYKSRRNLLEDPYWADSEDLTELKPPQDNPYSARGTLSKECFSTHRKKATSNRSINRETSLPMKTVHTADNQPFNPEPHKTNFSSCWQIIWQSATICQWQIGNSVFENLGQLTDLLIM